MGGRVGPKACMDVLQKSLATAMVQVLDLPVRTVVPIPTTPSWLHQ